MSSQIAESEPGFFLHVGPGERVLCCKRCGCRTRIEDRPGAKADAEAAHECAVPCGCWSAEAHSATSEGNCADP